MIDNLLTVEEVAPLVRLTKQGLYRAVRERQFPSVRIGKQVRIPASAVRAWIAAQTGMAQQQQTASAATA